MRILWFSSFYCFIPSQFIKKSVILNVAFLALSALVGRYLATRKKFTASTNPLASSVAFNTLPYEIFFRILGYLSHKDLTHLEATSKNIKEKLKSTFASNSLNVDNEWNYFTKKCSWAEDYLNSLQVKPARSKEKMEAIYNHLIDEIKILDPQRKIPPFRPLVASLILIDQWVENKNLIQICEKLNLVDESVVEQDSKKYIDNCRQAFSNYSRPSLDLSNSNLTRLPKEIGQCVNLESLNLHYNNLTSIPEEIGKCVKLMSLNLSQNNLTSIPEEIGKCVKLMSLNLSQNNLTSIPKEIGKCVKLTWLDLSQNNLTSIPEEIGKCVKLTWLDLPQNNLTSIPKEIGKCVKLTRLNLPQNNLTSIPKEIGKCVKLTRLDLSQNNLTSIPTELNRNILKI